MVLATLLFCLADRPSECPAQRQFRIEPRGCHLGSYRAEIPHDGKWTKAVVKIVCRR